MKNKTKDKLELALEITKNIPRAIVELGCIGSLVGGTLTATLGTAITYIAGNPEAAKNCLVYGITAAASGFVLGGVIGSSEDNLGIGNISDSIREYKDKKSGKISLEDLRFRYPNRDYTSSD